MYARIYYIQDDGKPVNQVISPVGIYARGDEWVLRAWNANDQRQINEIPMRRVLNWIDMPDCKSCGGSGSAGYFGCTDCLGTGVDPSCTF